MIMLTLILVLLIGGAVSWWSERFGSNTPRLCALAIVVADLIYLLVATSSLSTEPFAIG
ncbi:MAG: hypothetical protein ACJA2E_000560, partial [Arenicella sp.]